MNGIEARQKAVRKALKTKGVDALFLSSLNNIRYLTGFTGSSAFVLMTRDRGFFFTDFRYQEQAAAEVSHYEIGIEKGKRTDVLRTLLKKLGVKRLGFETSLPFDFYSALKRLPVEPVPVKDLVEELRKRKDDREIVAIRQAVERAERAFLSVKPRIRAGVREREIALRLDEHLKKEGCRTIPFDIIVASGGNAAMPHAKPTDKKIEKGDFVIIDWGGEAEGYCSDMTRTLLMAGGSPSGQTGIYAIVNEAREAALRAVRAGAMTRDIDRAAREVIRRAGYGEYFGHGTGHGVGLDVHENPRVSLLRNERVAPGTVFTIEPGIYLPGLGGVRIEDMVVVRKDTAELLTTLGRDLEVIGAARTIEGG